jgi:hypothetical protein
MVKKSGSSAIPPSSYVENVLPLKSGIRSCFQLSFESFPEIDLVYDIIDSQLSTGLTRSRSMSILLDEAFKLLPKKKSRLSDRLNRTDTARFLHNEGLEYLLLDYINVGRWGVGLSKESLQQSPPLESGIQVYVTTADSAGSLKVTLGKIKELRRKSRSALYDKKWATPESIDYTLQADYLVGKMLGYPECCISTYIDRRKKSFLEDVGGALNIDTPEQCFARELAKCGTYDYLKDKLIDQGFSFVKLFQLAEGELPEEFYSQFVMSFYPCQPKCEKATALGKRIQEQCKPIDPRLVTVHKASRLLFSLHNFLSDVFLAQRLGHSRKVEHWGKLSYLDGLPPPASIDKFDALRTLLWRNILYTQNLLAHYYMENADPDRLLALTPEAVRDLNYQVFGGRTYLAGSSCKDTQ